MNHVLESVPTNRLPSTPAPGEDSVAPVKDSQWVTRDGKNVRPMVDGCRLYPLVTHPDGRGSLTQFRPELFEEPVIDAHQVTIHPNMIKGWIMHQIQTDRLVFWQGDLRVVLYDAREDSPTFGMINDLCFGESRPVLFFIPPGVFHAVQNLSPVAMSHMSFPTVPYDHANPDKYRLPVDTDQIPFDLLRRGW